MKPKTILSWALYWTGDVLARTIVNHTLGHYFEWPYRLYSRCMITALNLQGDDPKGPWSPVAGSDNT